MWLSEIAEARQVSLACEIKLAAVFVDFMLKRKVCRRLMLSFSPSGTSGDLGWPPTDLSPVPRQDDRPTAKSSNLIFATWQ